MLANDISLSNFLINVSEFVFNLKYDLEITID